MPEYGNTIKKHYSEFTLGQTKQCDEVRKLKKAKSSKIVNLTKFIGIVTRMHNYINHLEYRNTHPGCKTVISTGFRKEYFDRNNKEDYFAANFSFTNAYTADKILKGNNIFLDDNILRLLSINDLLANIVKLANINQTDEVFDPYTNYNNISNTSHSMKLSKSTAIKILRKNYNYRDLNPCILSSLQLFAGKTKDDIDCQDDNVSSELLNGPDMTKIDNNYYTGSIHLQGLIQILDEDLNDFIKEYRLFKKQKIAPKDKTA